MKLTHTQRALILQEFLEKFGRCMEDWGMYQVVVYKEDEMIEEDLYYFVESILDILEVVPKNDDAGATKNPLRKL